jgi:hypothetical protein
MGRIHVVCATALVALAAARASGERWQDGTAGAIGVTSGWSNKVELADVDGDGDVDIIFANGGDYSTPGAPEPTMIFRNLGDRTFEDATDELLGSDPDNLARVVKVRDVDGDDVPDLFIGTTYQTQSRLFLGDGDGGLDEVTGERLPAMALSVGDLELGDVDGDGDLDAALADWGAGDPLENDGGRTHLWLQGDGGVFTDVTAERMPAHLSGMSWELELVDVDNDLDLDVLEACKVCSGSALYRNDGDGNFTDDSTDLPQFGNNYEFEAMYLDDDEWLDLVTINDGPDTTEHVFRGSAAGFTDATADLWPSEDNPGVDDNMVAFLDADSDGDADFLIGSLGGADRLLLNDGQGHLTMDDTIRDGTATPGTLGIALADLDGDRRLDLVDAQGEAAFADKVYFGVDLPVDTGAPAIPLVEQVTAVAAGGQLDVRARVHDFKTPVMVEDFAAVNLEVTIDGGSAEPFPMRWVGEALWRAGAPVPASGATSMSYRVCAEDAAGNTACSSQTDVAIGAAVTDAGPGGDGGPAADDGDGGGCGCRAGGGSAAGLALATLLALVTCCRRRAPRRSRRRRTTG